MDEKTELPFVTIAMPCLNEEGYIEECIRSVQAQTYAKNRIEILVVDGMSIDKTREILNRLAGDDGRIRVIDNPEKIQSAGLNAAIRKSRGEIVIRMDVHAEYAADFVEKCVEVLRETGADNVGGAARAKGRTWFQKALCAALDSPLAFGGSKYRNAENEGYVESVFPGAFRKSAFAKYGLFDSHAITNEDAELNQRIVDGGGKVYLSRKIIVHYYPRESFPALAKQYFKYGQGRARTLLKHKRFLSVRPAVPFLMVASETLLLATSAWHPLAWWSLGAYGTLTGAEAVRVGRREGIKAIPVVWAIFPVLHISHGVGFATGLAKYTFSPDWPDTPERLDSSETQSTNGVHSNENAAPFVPGSGPVKA